MSVLKFLPLRKSSYYTEMDLDLVALAAGDTFFWQESATGRWVVTHLGYDELLFAEEFI